MFLPLENFQFKNIQFQAEKYYLLFCKHTELMAIFATYNNGAFSVSNDNNGGDDADGKKLVWNMEGNKSEWKSNLIPFNAINLSKVLLCERVCVCISGLILSSFCFSVRLLRFQCHIESKSKLHNERGICIWCHSDGFDSIFFPCAIAALYAVLHHGHHVFHKHKHIDDIHATHIYWNVYV